MLLENLPPIKLQFNINLLEGQKVILLKCEEGMFVREDFVYYSQCVPNYFLAIFMLSIGRSLQFCFLISYNMTVN